MQSFNDTVLDILLSPAMWLCVLLGLAYGLLFTLWRGGGWRRAGRDCLLGVLGFGVGQLVATLLRLPTVRVGEVHLLWGSLAAVLFLIMGRRLWRFVPKPPKQKPGISKP